MSQPPHSSPRRGRRRGLAVLGLASLALAALAFWAQSPSGRLFLADHGLAPAQSWARERIDSTVQSTLERAGVVADSVQTSGPDAAQRLTIRVQTALPFAPLELALGDAVARAGGRVHRSRRLVAPGGTTLELELGTQGRVTHRLLFLRGPRPIEPPPPPLGRLALVIDDWGHNLSEPARRILDLAAPITVAILPELSHSSRILSEATLAGKHAILHLPMQPQEGSDVGPGDAAILVGMEPAEIRALTARFLDGLQGVVGVNNHMGSLATQSREVMIPVLELLAERRLYFLDSYTSPRSVAHKVAAELGLPSARNDLFLDVDTQDPGLVEQRLWKLVQRARRKGQAIGIGHVNDATATALERVLPQLDPTDVALVHLDELVQALPSQPAGSR